MLTKFFFYKSNATNVTNILLAIPRDGNNMAVITVEEILGVFSAREGRFFRVFSANLAENTLKRPPVID